METPSTQEPYNPLQKVARLPPSPAQMQFNRERSTAIRTVLRQLPRNSLALAILTGLGFKLPPKKYEATIGGPGWKPPRLTRDAIERTNAAIARMKAENAAESAREPKTAVLDTGTGKLVGFDEPGEVTEAMMRGTNNKALAAAYKLRRSGITVVEPGSKRSDSST